MAKWLQITALTLLAAVVGCRAPGPFRSLVASAKESGRASLAEKPDTVEPASLKTESPEQVGSVRIAVAENVLPASGSMSLADSLSLSLAQNPDLIAQRQTEDVGAAVLGVAQTYPFNPFIQVQATPYQDARNGGPGTTYHYVLLMQTIQLAHQQQFREAGACSALNTIRWNVHQAELLNVAQTERLYFNVLYQRGLRDIAVSLDANNRQLLTVLEKQLNAGQATAADVAIVRLDARSTQQQVRLAEANYRTALRDLRRQMGLSPDSDVQFPGDLRQITWRMPFADEAPNRPPNAVVVEYAAARPDVMAAHSDIDAARANLCLASASKTPDLQIGPYYQRTTDGTSFLGFRAQMDIPVVNTGRPLEDQRQAELGQRTAVWQQLTRRAELEAEAAWQRYELAYAAVQSETATGDNLPEELLKLEEQFRANEVDVVRIVQARTSLIQNQRTHLDLLNELAQAAAALTAASGMPVEALVDAMP